jgi:pentatricopeptide repeat protein
MVIEICAHAGEWKTAGYLLIEMRREGQTPDAASYVVAMQSCLEAGEKARTLGLWEEMGASGVEPSKEAWSLAMAAALDLRDWDRVDEMMEGLKAQVCRC